MSNAKNKERMRKAVKVAKTIREKNGYTTKTVKQYKVSWRQVMKTAFQKVK